MMRSARIFVCIKPLHGRVGLRLPFFGCECQKLKCRRANGADGISDIEGKVARVAASELRNERVSISREDCPPRRNHEPSQTDQIARKTDGRDPRSQTRRAKSGQGLAAARS